MSGFTKEQIEQLEQQHERIAVITHRDPNVWSVVLRPPVRKEFKRFRAMMHNDAQKADAQETLVRVLVVATVVQGQTTLDAGKAREALDALLEKYPAICDSDAVAVALRRLTSDAAEAEEK